MLARRIWDGGPWSWALQPRDQAGSDRGQASLGREKRGWRNQETRWREQAPSWTKNVNHSRRTSREQRIAMDSDLQGRMTEFEEQLGRDPRSFSPPRRAKTARLTRRRTREKRRILGLVQTRRWQGDTVDRSQRVQWLRLSARNPMQDGGLHPPYWRRASPSRSKGVQQCYLRLNQAEF